MCALMYLVPGIGRGSYWKAQTKHHAWSFGDETHQVEGDGQVGSSAARLKKKKKDESIQEFWYFIVYYF